MRLGRFYILGLVAACLAGGCTTKKAARAEAARAFAAAQLQATQAQAGDKVVTIVGQVRNKFIPWRDGLTLAEAIDAAVYTGFTDPRSITLARGTERLEVSVRDLLRGAVNPTLEAGDVIEIRR